MKLKFVLEYILLFIISKLVRLLPENAAILLGKGIGRLAFLLWMSRRRLVIENLSLTLGIDSVEATNMAGAVFKNIGLTLVESFRLPSISNRYIEEHVEIEGLENYLEAKSRSKGLFLLAAHLGNWELLGAVHVQRGAKLNVIYKRPKNPYVDRMLYDNRKKSGIETIPHRNSARKIMEALKNKEEVGILLDQHTLSKEAIVIDFMGRPAATNYGLALMALKTGTPVVPFFLVRQKNGKYKLIYEKAIYPEKSGDTDEDIKKATILYTRIIEQKVREYPDQWFWIHKRWKVKA